MCYRDSSILQKVKLKYRTFEPGTGLNGGAVGTGESTTALTEQMTMRSITNAEYAGIDDINITLTGYAIGVEDVPTVPEEAWEHCKLIEESQ